MVTTAVTIHRHDGDGVATVIFAPSPVWPEDAAIGGVCKPADKVQNPFFDLSAFRDGQRLQDPKWLYRLEAKDPEHGLWYDASGEWVYDVGRLGCSTKDLPMDYDWRYQQDGRSWFSSCSSRDDLLHWYSRDDAARLIDDGFVFTRYLALEYVEYELETVFIRETALAREELDFDSLWSE